MKFLLNTNTKFFLKNFIIFSIFFLAMLFNMSLIPSIFNKKLINIQKFKSLIGINGEKQEKTTCNLECASDCLISDKDSQSEEYFKNCLINCNCEYTQSNIPNAHSNSYILAFFRSIIVPLNDHYLLFCILFSFTALIYLNFTKIKYVTIKLLGKYSPQIKDYLPLSVLGERDCEKYEKLLASEY